MKCNDIEMLKNHITELYKVKGSQVSEVQIQFRINEFIANIFSNGTVNFQGKPNEKLKQNISNYIEIINKDSN